MKKKDFLIFAKGKIEEILPNWNDSFMEAGSAYIGREIQKKVYVYVDVSTRPDNYKVSCGVGWAPSKDAKIKLLNLKKNQPIKLRDGRLKNIQIIESPKDFQYEDLSIPVFTLYKPFGGFNLEADSPDDIANGMINEINQYALPYLSLMLKKRFDLIIEPENLK